MIPSGNTDAHDICALYTQIREFTNKNSLTREIGDLFAHPKKTFGPLFNKINSVFSAIEDNTPPDQLINTPFSEKELIDDLNKELDSLGIEQFSDVSRKIISLLLLSAFQGYVFKGKGKLEVISFLAVRDEKIISLCVTTPYLTGGRKVVIPLMSIPNHFGLPQFLPSHVPDSTIVNISFNDGAPKYFQTHEPIIGSFEDSEQKKANKKNRCQRAIDSNISKYCSLTRFFTDSSYGESW